MDGELCRPARARRATSSSPPLRESEAGAPPPHIGRRLGRCPPVRSSPTRRSRPIRAPRSDRAARGTCARAAPTGSAVGALGGCRRGGGPRRCPRLLDWRRRRRRPRTAPAPSSRGLHRWQRVDGECRRIRSVHGHAPRVKPGVKAGVTAGVKAGCVPSRRRASPLLRSPASLTTWTRSHCEAPYGAPRKTALSLPCGRRRDSTHGNA